MAKDDDDADWQSDEEQQSSASSASVSSSTTPTPAPKKRKRNNNGGGTAARMTEYGGYAHTMDSKIKISRANKGNTPWNKGKERSAADRAKIAAGVRARNRAILLEKLNKIGMTEEEWFEKKKQLKYLRERVRRAKKAKDDKALKEHQDSLNNALAEQERVTAQPSEAEEKLRTKPRKKPPPAKKRPANAIVVPPKAKINPVKPPKNNNSSNNNQNGTATKEDTATTTATITTSSRKRQRTTTTSDGTVTAPGGVKLDQIFSRDITWTDHPFDTSDLELPYETCPTNNGPGGLICCAACTQKYSSYLNATAKDIEEQKTHKVIKEVSELMGFLSTSRAKMDTALKLAKQRTGGSLLGLGAHFSSRSPTTTTARDQPPPPLNNTAKKPPPQKQQQSNRATRKNSAGSQKKAPPPSKPNSKPPPLRQNGARGKESQQQQQQQQEQPPAAQIDRSDMPAFPSMEAFLAESDLAPLVGTEQKQQQQQEEEEHDAIAMVAV